MKNLILFTTFFTLLMTGSTFAQNITYVAPFHHINSPDNYYTRIATVQAGGYIYTNSQRFFINKPIWAITGEFSAYNNKNLQLQTNGTTRMTILKSNGNAGIGIPNPTSKFHVVSSGNERGISSYSDHGDSHFPWSNGSAYISGESIIFRIVNSAKMILAADGNVGIGTDTPDNKLDVNGIIRAKEIKVEEGWSDYVFYDDYQLPTLEEEEKHIEANGHLLGFESEKAMAGEIQLGDVSKRQQAKIEEMMLHLIEIKKEVKQLKEENEQLKEQISKN